MRGMTCVRAPPRRDHGRKFAGPKGRRSNSSRPALQLGVGGVSIGRMAAATCLRTFLLPNITMSESDSRC